MERNPKISLILSTFERTDILRSALYSLKNQTFKDFEVIVTDNSISEEWATKNIKAVAGLRNKRFKYLNTGLANCYESAEEGARMAKGEYIGFPSDDDFYVTEYLEIMMEGDGSDLIICNTVYDHSDTGRYYVLESSPTAGGVDKGGFLVKKEIFDKFKFREKSQFSNSDGLLIEDVINSGASCKKFNEILFLHG